MGIAALPRGFNKKESQKPRSALPPNDEGKMLIEKSKVKL
mgnify:CR=1 FL=1